MIFDVVPRKMFEMVRRLPGPDSGRAATLWTWLFDSDERETISEIPGLARVRDLTPPIALGVGPLALTLVRRLPRRVRYALPVFPVLEITFG